MTQTMSLPINQLRDGRPELRFDQTCSTRSLIRLSRRSALAVRSVNLTTQSSQEFKRTETTLKMIFRGSQSLLFDTKHSTENLSASQRSSTELRTSERRGDLN